MASSVLEQYRISDLIQWHDQKQLVLNPVFQRRSVWSVQAKVFLVDTILRQLPLPKIYMRTKVDLTSKKSLREIVDGQQRLRAIIEFSQDKFALSSRAKEFAGLTYSAMDSDLKERFLSFPIAVDQLINASDNDVLEVFARLNVYNVRLNSAELRHAQYQGNFKWAVHEMSRKFAGIWEKYNTVTVSQRLRMQDDSLMSEFFSIILKGVSDGGQAAIDRLYRDIDPNAREDEMGAVSQQVGNVLTFIIENFDEVLIGSVISRAPHFLMLFAAVAHALIGIPVGEMQSEMPVRSGEMLRDVGQAQENLATLDRLLSAEAPEREFFAFWTASMSSTQRIASRKMRFPVYFRALMPQPIQ